MGFPSQRWGVSPVFVVLLPADHRRMSYEAPPSEPIHSAGWVAQVWIAFAVSVGAAAIGIFFAPIDPWIRAFLGISFLMAISSSISLSKTVRDLHESSRLVRKIDEAKVTKLLTEHPAQF